MVHNVYCSIFFHSINALLEEEWVTYFEKWKKSIQIRFFYVGRGKSSVKKMK